MKALTLVAAVVALCALTVAVRAEDKKADNAKLLVGVWEVVKADKGGPPVGSTIEFTKDLKMKISIKGGDKNETFEGTYTVDGDKFVFVVKIGDDVKKSPHTIKKLSETELTTANEQGAVVEMKKKN